MDISFELYKVFYHVASTLSFSEASRQLFISQSAVSQSVKSLEQKLDVYKRQLLHQPSQMPLYCHIHSWFPGIPV